MAICPTNCTPPAILANPSGTCVISPRRTTPSRIFFYACQTTLPNPVTNANMLAMYQAGTLVPSVELTNMVFEAPNFENIQLSDCRPPLELISTRTITFEDRTGIIDNTASPTYNLFADYDFWFNKISNNQQLNYMIAYCNGDVKIPVDANGFPLFATLSGYLDYIKAQQAGGASTETKKMKLVFQGDPLALNIKPAFNFINAGFNI